MDIMLSLQGLGSFLLYFAAGIAAEAIFVALYIAVTPHREPTLIKAGDTAAAVSLGGAVLGFTLPLASAIANSVAIVDMAVWSGVALVVQLRCFCSRAYCCGYLAPHREERSRGRNHAGRRRAGDRDRQRRQHDLLGKSEAPV